MRNASGMLRRGPAGKTRDGKIWRAPEKMDRTAFPAEARSKFFEDAVGLDQNTPESIGIFRVVRAMLLVAIERNRIRNLVRQYVDLDGEIELVQRGHDRLVEIRHAARFQFDRLPRAVAFQNPKLVIDEIKADLKRVSSVRNRRSRQTAGSNIKRDVPGMVGPWRESQSNLADNLRPHVERGAGFFPIRVIQLRPNFSGSARFHCSNMPILRLPATPKRSVGGRSRRLTIDVIRKRTSDTAEHTARLILGALKISPHPLSHAV